MIDFLDIAVTKSILYSLVFAFILWILLLFLQTIVKKPTAKRYIKIVALFTYTLGVLFYFIDLLYSSNSVHKDEHFIYDNSIPIASNLLFESLFKVEQWILVNSLFISIIWSIGFLYTMFRFTKNFKEIKHYQKTSIPCNNTQVFNLLKTIKNGFGIKKYVEIRISSLLSSPMTTGFFKPIIYLPVGLISGYSSNEIEIILRHELAHIKRHDYLINNLLSFIEALFFFNPIIINVIQDIRLDMEIICDDEVLKHHDKVKYINTLLKLQETQTKNKLLLAAAKKSNSAFKTRMERMIFPYSKNKKSGILVLITVSSIFLLSATVLKLNRSSNIQVSSFEKQSTETLKTNQDMAHPPRTASIKNEHVNDLELIPKESQRNTNEPSRVVRSIVQPGPFMKWVHQELIKDGILNKESPKITLMFQYSDILNGPNKLGKDYQKYKAKFKSDFPDYDSYATTKTFRYTE